MVSRFRRYGQIADVLVKYGFGIAIDELFPGVRKWKFFEKHFPEKRPVYERMRLAIEELGPTFIKFGQIASTRTELLPPELIEELHKLQDRVAPVPFSQVRPIIEDYCGCLEEVFSTVEEEPIGSASIALVYRGQLRDGTQVALKVQRPNIAELIEKDLVILQALAKRVEVVFPDLRVYNPTGMVQDFATQIRKELDFVRDGRNADRLRQNMKGVPGVRCPRIYWKYSGARLLVMEYVEGVRVDDREGIRAFGLSPREIGKKGFHAYMKQIFEDGFFHGDPHPGNLIVTRTGNLVFLDFGIMGIIRPEKRHTFTNLVLSILGNDVDLMIRSLEQLGVRVKPEQMDSIRDDLFIILMDYSEFELKDVNFSRVIQELTTAMRRYNMQVPMTLMLMLKVLLMVADIGRSLDPEFNFSAYVGPYMEELEEKDLAVRELMRKARLSATTAVEGMLELPANLNAIMKRFSSGSLMFEVADTDLQRLQRIMDRSSDKVLVGLITAALVVGSSLVIFASRTTISGPLLILASLVYAVAVIIGFIALYYSLV
jgi:ubiquinone biosynthesis protein